MDTGDLVGFKVVLSDETKVASTKIQLLQVWKNKGLGKTKVQKKTVPTSPKHKHLDDSIL